MVIPLHGFLYFAILPTIMSTILLILCGNPRPKKQEAKKSDKKTTRSRSGKPKKRVKRSGTSSGGSKKTSGTASSGSKKTSETASDSKQKSSEASKRAKSRKSSKKKSSTAKSKSKKLSKKKSKSKKSSGTKSRKKKLSKKKSKSKKLSKAKSKSKKLPKIKSKSKKSRGSRQSSERLFKKKPFLKLLQTSGSGKVLKREDSLRSSRTTQVSSAATQSSKRNVIQGISRSFQKMSFAKQPEIIYTNRSLTRRISEEPKPELMMKPRNLNWSTTGGLQKVYLTNPSDERRAIKVKCSDNFLYRVNPVYGFVEPGQTLHVDVARQNGSAKVDKMVFLWTAAGENEKSASRLFNDISSYPMLVLPLTVNDYA